MNQKVILFLAIGAVGLFVLYSNQPLVKFKEKFSAGLEQCVGVIGTVDYQQFTSSKDSNIEVIEVTLEKKGKEYSPFKLQYQYNKSTKILSDAPSAYAKKGEWVSKFDGMVSLGIFCM